MKRAIVPSILSADFAYLARDVQVAREAGAESVQIDVMDGHFVPNITVGPIVVQALRKATPLFLDVHLMINQPLEYVMEFAKAGADLLTLHWEACPDPLKAIQTVKALRAQPAGRPVKVGLAVRPKTPVEVLEPLLPHLDLALVMTVEPGFGGQAFMPEMLDKVRWLRRKLGPDSATQVQVDGGINVKTAPLAAQAGANSLVAGTAVFGAPDPIQAFRHLQSLVDSAPVGK